MLMMHPITTHTSSAAHRRMITRVLAAAALGMVLASITACNTVEGVGKDTAAVGDGVADAARDAKN